MFKRLLVPLDGSELAEAALPHARELARQFEAEIVLLRVVRPPQVAASSGGPALGELVVEVRNQSLTDAEEYLDDHQKSLRQKKFKAQTLIVEGEQVAQEILDAADSLDIDTIVMSTHGRGGLSRWVFGSVADKVLRRAKVPLLLVRSRTKK